MSYPDNWGVSESDGGAAFAPKGGVVQGADGQGALAYGLIVNVRAEQIDSERFECAGECDAAADC